jgi:hypothetical protein
MHEDSTGTIGDEMPTLVVPLTYAEATQQLRRDVYGYKGIPSSTGVVVEHDSQPRPRGLALLTYDLDIEECVVGVIFRSRLHGMFEVVCTQTKTGVP